MSTPMWERAVPGSCGCFCRRVLSKENIWPYCWLQEGVFLVLLSRPSDSSTDWPVPPLPLSWAIPSCSALTASLPVLGTGFLLESSFQTFSRTLRPGHQPSCKQMLARSLGQAQPHFLETAQGGKSHNWEQNRTVLCWAQGQASLTAS